MTKSSLETVLQCVRSVWPEHERYLNKSFLNRTGPLLEDSTLLASTITSIAEDDLERVALNYKWTCEQLWVETLEFRRTGRYRFSTFSEVSSTVYNNASYMERYLDGLLLSQLLWENHFRAFSYLRRSFLPNSPQGYRYLEIGPGHGVLTLLAAIDPNCATATAWDLSQTALDKAAHSIKKASNRSNVNFELRDATSLSEVTSKFDNIVMSEILEHTENPTEILKSVSGLLSKEGRIFVNFPVNSPAVDHIYHLATAKEVQGLVESAGFRVTDLQQFPLTGYSLERAAKLNATISCVIVARPNDQ